MLFIPSASESRDTFRLQEEPATSSPLNSIAEISTFSRGGMNKSRHSLRSSEFDFEKFRAENSYENRDDEGFYSDATISVYFQVQIVHFINYRGQAPKSSTCLAACSFR